MLRDAAVTGRARPDSSISGGVGNIASGQNASVSGGPDNTAATVVESVPGGDSVVCDDGGTGQDGMCMEGVLLSLD